MVSISSKATILALHIYAYRIMQTGSETASRKKQYFMIYRAMDHNIQFMVAKIDQPVCCFLHSRAPLLGRSQLETIYSHPHTHAHSPFMKLLN